MQGYKAGPQQAAQKQVRQVAWSDTAAEDPRWTEKGGEIGPLEATGDLSPLATGPGLVRVPPVPRTLVTTGELERGEGSTHRTTPVSILVCLCCPHLFS